MPYTSLKLGSATESRESLDVSLRKVEEMIVELYATTSEGDFSSISQNIVPDSVAPRTLGTQANPWQEIYVVSLDGGTASSTYE
jgi:hypothetical protein